MFTVQGTPERMKGRTVRSKRELNSLISKKSLDELGLLSLKEIRGKGREGEQGVLQLNAEKHRKERAEIVAK